MRQSLMAALIVLGLLGSSATSEAGIGDFIWELSGPQMIGAGVTCRFTLKGEFKYCDWSAGIAGRITPTAETPFWSKDRVFWSLGGAGYFSTGKNSRYKDNLSCPDAATPCVGDEIDYHDFDHWMLSFEPTADYLVVSCGCASFFLTAGPAFHTVLNRDADDFFKVGIKIAPEVRFDNFTVSYNLRFYPDGFTPDQFGKGVFRGGDRPSEWTQGVSVSFPFKRH